MASAKVKVRELFSELLEDEHLENGLAESGLAAPRDLMKGLVSELRAGAREAQVRRYWKLQRRSSVG
jgi:hypothetical protein